MNELDPVLYIMSRYEYLLNIRAIYKYLSEEEQEELEMIQEYFRRELSKWILKTELN